MAGAKCFKCLKPFKDQEKRWGVRKVKGTWKCSPQYAADGLCNAYHAGCASQVAYAQNQA